MRSVHVELLIDGQTVRSQSSGSINWTASAPAAVSTFTVNVRVTDNVGQVTLGNAKTFTVHPTVALGAVGVDGFANDVAVQSSFAYVAAGPAGSRSGLGRGLIRLIPSSAGAVEV